MKIQILDQTGNKIKDIESNIFDSNIREDIVQKIVEVEKIAQESAPFFQAGMQTSASGNVRHLRHSWKTDRGRGMARVPKKRMSDRGARFHWVGAVIPGTRGGRRAHPPKTGGKLGKINKREYMIGLRSALAMSCSSDLLKQTYASLKDKKIDIALPLTIDSNVLSLKTKEFVDSIKKIIGEDLERVAIQKRSIRAGKGKLRGRRYKKNAGMLLVIGNKEDKRANSINVIKVNDLDITDIAPNGARLIMFTEASIKDLEERMKK